jgi:hypothetical protein
MPERDGPDEEEQDRTNLSQFYNINTINDRIMEETQERVISEGMTMSPLQLPSNRGSAKTAAKLVQKQPLTIQKRPIKSVKPLSNVNERNELGDTLSQDSAMQISVKTKAFKKSRAQSRVEEQLKDMPVEQTPR